MAESLPTVEYRRLGKSGLRVSVPIVCFYLSLELNCTDKVVIMFLVVVGGYELWK